MKALSNDICWILIAGMVLLYVPDMVRAYRRPSARTSRRDAIRRAVREVTGR